MSIFNKKSFLFPYLIIASSIAGIEQPKSQDSVILLTENLSNYNHISTKSHFIDTSEQYGQYLNTENKNNFNQNSKYTVDLSNLPLSESQKLTKFEDNLSSETNLNISLSNENPFLFNQNNYHGLYGNNVNYKEINARLNNLLSNSISKTELDNLMLDRTVDTLNSKNINIYFYNLLLTLFNLGLVSAFGFFIHYKNQKAITSRIENLKRKLRFNYNCGFFSFWQNESIFSANVKKLDNLKEFLILSVSNINKNFINLFVSKINHYSIP